MPLDLGAVPEGMKAYAWNADTGLSRRVIPGQGGGMHTVTGLSHDEGSKVAYSAGVHAKGMAMRSRKLAVLGSPASSASRSLSRNGTPANGPVRPAAASARARANIGCTTAFSVGFRASIRSIAASMTSVAETAPVRTSSARPVAS